MMYLREAMMYLREQSTTNYTGMEVSTNF